MHIDNSIDRLTETAEGQLLWFDMLISYMLVKTFELWLRHYPRTTAEEFNLIWPRLLDSMLQHATREAASKLRQQPHIHSNN
jgi:hypothetical protein